MRTLIADSFAKGCERLLLIHRIAKHVGLRLRPSYVHRILQIVSRCGVTALDVGTSRTLVCRRISMRHMSTVLYLIGSPEVIPGALSIWAGKATKVELSLALLHQGDIPVQIENHIQI